jgi:hypothetical protein
MVTMSSRAATKRPISEEQIIFGRVIAEREYRVGGRKILLQIGTPHRASWRTAWYCPFRITSGRKTKLHRTFGVDAVQALMLAFDLVTTTLKKTSPKISWEAGQYPGDVGIYRRLTTSLGTDIDRRIGEFADRAIRARGRELKRLSGAGPIASRRRSWKS